jgi:hypothetical protein
VKYSPQVIIQTAIQTHLQIIIPEPILRLHQAAAQAAVEALHPAAAVRAVYQDREEANLEISLLNNFTFHPISIGSDKLLTI